MTKFRQLRLLLWKNFVLQRRHPVVTIFEVGVPCLFSVILVLIRLRVDSTYVSQPTFYKAFAVDVLPSKIANDVVTRTFYAFQGNDASNEKPIKPMLWYAPDEKHIISLMEDFKHRIGDLKLRGFHTEEDLIANYNPDRTLTEKVFGAVIFPEERFRTTLKPDIKITLRLPNTKPENSNPFYSWKTDFSFPSIQPLGPRGGNDSYGGEPGYYSTGFLTLQHQLSLSIISHLAQSKSANISDLELEMERFPFPPYYNDFFINAIQFLFPLALLMSFIYPVLNIVRVLVVEKERRIKESMKMMGLSNWLHWTAWFLKNFLFLIISLIIMVIFLKIKVKNNLGVITYSDGSIIFLLLMLYVISTISLCFLISVFFSKANSAAAGAGILFLLAYVPYFFIFTRYNTTTAAVKFASCFLSNTAMPLGIMVISMWEGSGVGVQWANIADPAYPEDSISVLTIMGMLALDSVIYMILCWYIEAVFPGEYGVPQPWYFPLTRVYWCGNHEDSGLTPLLAATSETAYFEKDPHGLSPGIEIMDLTKVFPKSKIAVKSIQLKMYRSQITVLLGHNGAGKTTTMSMLTGLFPPTSGTALVNGYDIRDDIDSVHGSLGICPQHDVLFDEMTVQEHLYFFCKLKGYIPDLVESEVERILEAIGLVEKRDALSKTLSGGMKRKLSVGMALVGGSQVVMLDEPTSGMDPAARRFTWDLLQSEKQDRTILLTTHFMEEADVLGDRIAIMAEGEVQCCGSPLFLKKKYGAGYHLVMVKGPKCNVTAVTATIQTHVPCAMMESNIGMELTYSLPHDSSEHFERLFDELEQNKSILGVDSYGASITTMEEVFIKVGEYSQNAMNKLKHAQSNSAEINDDSGIQLNGNSYACTLFDPQDRRADGYVRNTGARLMWQQIKALMIKHMLHTWRHRILTFSQLLLPVAFLIFTLAIIKSKPKDRSLPPRVIDLQPFGENYIPYGISDNPDPFTKNLSEVFISQFQTGGKSVVVPVDDPLSNGTEDAMQQYILQGAESNPLQFYLHTIVAATFDNSLGNVTKIKSFFNNQAFHSPAIALSTMDNAFLRYFTNSTSNSITITNHPLPRTLTDDDQLALEIGYQVSQDIIFGMAFLLASFTVFLVAERSSKARHLQQLSGVSSFNFWATTFLWNFINYIIPCVMVMMCFLGFQTEGFSTAEQQGRLLLLFVIHGLASLPFVYCLSFLFQVPSTSYVRLSLFFILGGLACIMAVIILEVPQIGLKNISKVLDWVFTIILPNYCLGRSVFQLYQNHVAGSKCIPLQQYCFPDSPAKMCCADFCGDDCMPWTENYLSFKPPGIGRPLVFLAIQTFVYFFILYAAEIKFGRRLSYLLCRKKNVFRTWPSEEQLVEADSDVIKERERILCSPLADLLKSDTLVLQQLTKFYDGHLAVDQITLGIKKGECFGLLGLNGAGKSSTFKMLTGDESFSSGDAFLDGLSLKTHIRQLQPRMGYCPQTDSLIGLMTGRETLTLFSRLRGIPESRIPSIVERLSKMLYFDMHIDKLVKDYSGGNKRKLNTAIALVGDPPIVFLDEPTTGMDPVARRCLWDALIKVLQAGQSVILTSHSMEECEALCTRLVIMVNGKFCCLGSPQHLKNKFGQGFTLMIKVGRKSSTSLARQNSLTSEAMHNSVEQVRTFVEATFPGSTLKSIHQGLLHYHIPENLQTWGQVFGTMERAKQMLNIENYSVGQTTLEQVFLNFARLQHDTS